MKRATANAATGDVLEPLLVEAQLLIAARALVSRGWCREAAAADRDGVQVAPTAASACRWSATGALDAVSHYRRTALRSPEGIEAARTRALLALAAVVGDVESWNRSPERTQADVLAALEDALALVERLPDARSSEGVPP
jgi:hypothetical protein